MKKAYPNHLIWAGFDEMMVPAVSLGVDGAIGSTFNVNGVRARQIFELTKQGKLADALQVQHVTNDLIEGILANGFISHYQRVIETRWCGCRLLP